MLRIGYDDGTPFTKYILSDHLGSSNVILETSGAVYNLEEYYPFGETSFGAFGKKRYRYVGKEKDEESGLYYYGARYFQPWSCRFISVDPLAADYPFYTPYQYAGNKPITKIDRDGLEETGSSPQQNNVEQPTKTIEELVIIDPEYATEPVKPKVDQANKLKRNEGESKDDFKKRKEDSRKQWSAYNQEKSKYDFLQQARNNLINADKNSELGRLRESIIEKGLPVKLTYGNVEGENHPVGTNYNYDINKDGTYKIKSWTITFDWVKITQMTANGQGTTASDRYNTDFRLGQKDPQGRWISGTKDMNFILPSPTSMLVHELGHIDFFYTHYDVNKATYNELKNWGNASETYAEEVEYYYYAGRKH
jgi:RHS repeat-associated protein